MAFTSETSPTGEEVPCSVMDLDLVRNVTAKVKSFGNIHQHLDLIAGLPGEDLDSFHKSFDDVFAMEPEQLQLGFLKVLRGTKIHRMAQQYGIICHDKAPYEVLSTPWLPYKDLLLLKGVEEMVELYYNSHQYEKTLEEILKNYGSPFAFFVELAEFYDRKGYSKISHSRMARYEILREFISEKPDIMKERKSYTTKNRLVILDYLKENCSTTISAADIKKHLEEKEISVNTTTVYRLLDKLCAENVIIKYSDINSDKAVYQYAGEKGHCREHLHLKCIKCGKVMHLDCGFMDELREHIMEEHHFQLQCSGDLLHGLCEECAKNSDF